MEKTESAPESLVETVVQLHWSTPVQRPHLAGGMVLLQPGDEVLCLQFGAQIAQLGYSQVQRLVPPGVPVVPVQQPLYKYISPNAPSLVYQLGVDQLSIHFVKPFKDWSENVKDIQQGADRLLQALQLGGNSASFTSITLRHIYGFADDDTVILDWLREAFDIHVTFPLSLSSAMEREAKPDFSFNLKTPLAANEPTTLTLNIRKGELDKLLRIILDSSLTCNSPIEMERVADSLNSLHAQWDTIFSGMASKI